MQIGEIEGKRDRGRKWDKYYFSFIGSVLKWNVLPWKVESSVKYWWLLSSEKSTTRMCISFMGQTEVRVIVSALYTTRKLL